MQNVVILKKLTCKGTLRQGYLSEAQKEPHTRPHYTLYPCIQYTHSQREEGEGGGVKPERRGVGQQGRVQITKLGSKYQHDGMYARNWLSLVYKL
jgi:hypothetical protein